MRIADAGELTENQLNLSAGFGSPVRREGRLVSLGFPDALAWSVKGTPGQF